MQKNMEAFASSVEAHMYVSSLKNIQMRVAELQSYY